MKDWIVALISLATAIVGFVGGFFTKTLALKVKQKARGNSNKQNIKIDVK